MNYNSKIINKEIVLIIDIVFRLCEVADSQHKCSIEKPNLNLALNCQRVFKKVCHKKSNLR